MSLTVGDKLDFVATDETFHCGVVPLVNSDFHSVHFVNLSLGEPFPFNKIIKS
jgi:hypothetical protein